MQVGYNFLHHCLQQIVILVDIMVLKNYISEKHTHLSSVAVSSDQVSKFMLIVYHINIYIYTNIPHKTQGSSAVAVSRL